jgi:lipid II:glycine glycyltransferase (peptidoglycan interpeptide bridge formation enzyme)
MTAPGVDHCGRRAAAAVTLRRVYHAEQWNRIVQQFDRYDVKQGFEWGEFRAEQGWRVVRMVASRNAEPIAACAVLHRSVPALGAVLYAPRGPLYRADVPEGLSRIVAEIRALGQHTRAVFARMSPGVPAHDAPAVACLEREGLAPIPEPWTTWNTPRHVQVLDLRRDEPDLLRRVRRRYREYISAAPRKGLVIQPSERDEDIVAFHGLMVNLGRIKRFPVRDLAWYRGLIHHYHADRGVTLLVARAAGSVVGGLLALRFGRRSYMLYTSVRGNAPESIRHHIAPAITWDYVRRARSEGTELADFGGSGVQLPPRETDAGWGVYRFKAGLGCSLETFVPFQDIVLRPDRYRLFRACEARLLPWLWNAVARSPYAWPARAIGAGA